MIFFFLLMREIPVPVGYLPIRIGETVGSVAQRVLWRTKRRRRIGGKALVRVNLRGSEAGY